ncbi:MAG: hypothetical protein AAFQ40_14900 [Cyanobacteria bacterium J06623_5]
MLAVRSGTRALYPTKLFADYFTDLFRLAIATFCCTIRANVGLAETAHFSITVLGLNLGIE